MIDSDVIRLRYAVLSPHLDERARRLFAASEARAAGYGGIAAVSRGDRHRGQHDRSRPEGTGGYGRVANRAGPPSRRRTQAAGDDGRDAAGRSAGTGEPSERGDPMSPLRWTCKSLSQLAAELGGTVATGSAARWSASCCISRSSVCKPTARPARATAIPIATRSSLHINEQRDEALAAGNR